MALFPSMKYDKDIVESGYSHAYRKPLSADQMRWLENAHTLLNFKQML
jgi:hypothetical protein